MHVSEKIRVTDKERKMSGLDVLMKKKKEIIKKKILCEKDKDKLEVLVKEISLAYENREWEKLTNILGSLETENGSTNNTKVWKEMSKAYPKKSKILPTGVNNIENQIVTNPKEKKSVILDHFLERLKEKAPKEEVKNILDIGNEIFENRLKIVKKSKSSLIKMEELEIAIKSRKLGKSRDPEGMICDTFREGVIRSDLKLSLLMMFNRMKNEVIIPELLRTANITMLQRRKVKQI